MEKKEHVKCIPQYGLIIYRIIIVQKVFRLVMAHQKKPFLFVLAYNASVAPPSGQRLKQLRISWM